MSRFIAIVAFLAVVVAMACAQDFYSPSNRDPRQNRGPVVFPMTSPGSETSGVRVGASGYGFVAPGRGGFGPHPSGPNPGFGSFYPGFSSYYWS